MDNRLKILNHLGKNIGREFTMHELSKATKIPYATFYRTVKLMDELVVLRSVGKATTMAINTENTSLKAYLTIASEEERKEFLKKKRIISKIASEISTNDTVLLFGSYAKGTEREESDIDLLIINKDGKRTLSFAKQETLFKKKINPIFITPTEFTLMLQEKEENVGKQALKNHIILKNPEKFWEMVLSG